MAVNGEIASKIGSAVKAPLVSAGAFLANGSHAQQSIPAQHRLKSAGGMFVGWWALDKLRDYAFGITQTTEGHFVEVKKEDVPLPLRWLHKTIEWDPLSDSPENQHKKIIYQVLPMIGAAAGTIMGSRSAFTVKSKGADGKLTDSLVEKFDKITASPTATLLEADTAKQFSQGGLWQWLTTAFGGEAAASGLTPAYGMALNSHFLDKNGGRNAVVDILKGFGLKLGNANPAKSVGTLLKDLPEYIKAVETGDNTAINQWAEKLTNQIGVLFSKDFKDPKVHEEILGKIQGLVQKSYEAHTKNHIKIEELQSLISQDVKGVLEGKGFDEFLVKGLGLKLENATLGNANPFSRSINNYLHSVEEFLGFNPKNEAFYRAKASGETLVDIEKTTASKIVKPLAVAGVVGGGVLLASKAIADDKPLRVNIGDGTNGENTATDPNKPTTGGKTAAEYTYDMLKYHQSQYADKQPNSFLKWVGDAALAVYPKNRLASAVGLSGGLIAGGAVANHLTGYTLLDSKAIEKPMFGLGWVRNIGSKLFKDYNPKGIDNKNKYIKYAQIALYSLGGMLGVKEASDWVYSGAVEKAKEPKYLEDYLTRTSHHEGETWGWASAASSIFGSASGTWMLPIPGLNYAMGMMSRILTMQDRSSVIPIMNEYMSGASTASYLHLKEGSHYLCEYAVGNPSKEPTDIEYLAFTLLGPLFKDKLTADHIKQFSDAVNAVRTPFLDETGKIPKERRKEALATMKEVFTGAGLEVMLIDMGLNPASVDFNKINGWIGKLGNLGQSDNIKKEQDDYLKAISERLPKYVAEGVVSQERADWVQSGIEDLIFGRNSPELACMPSEISTPMIQEVTEAVAEKHEAKKQVFSGVSKTFLGAKSRENPVDKLIKDAQKNTGDWRDLALGQKQNMDAPVVSR